MWRSGSKQVRLPLGWAAISPSERKPATLAPLRNSPGSSRKKSKRRVASEASQALEIGRRALRHHAARTFHLSRRRWDGEAPFTKPFRPAVDSASPQEYGCDLPSHACFGG